MKLGERILLDTIPKGHYTRCFASFEVLLASH